MTTPAAEIVEEIPIPEGHRRVPNRELVDIRNALVALSQRRLSKLDNHKKIVTLLRRYFDVPWKIYQDLKNKVISDHPAPEAWESEGLPIGVQEARTLELLNLDDDTQDIPEIPEHLLIVDADLPAQFKGELGDQNQIGLGDILHKLHFVYGGWDDDEVAA